MTCETTINTKNGTIWAIPLVRHLAVVILLKLAFLFLLWFLFFRPPTGVTDPVVDVHDHIAGAPAPHPSQQYE